MPNSKEKQTVEIPEKIQNKIIEHLKQLQDLDAQFNAYISGIADANNVPSGWLFDKQSLNFYSPDLKEIPIE